MDPVTIAALGGSAIKGLSGFFGSKSAEKKALQAQQLAARQYGQGVTQAQGQVNEAAGTADSYYQPYAAQGQQANTLYGDAIGVNGRPAQEAFFSSWVDDPGFEATQQAGRQQVEHSNIVRGTANSGAAMKELFDFGQRSKYGQFQDRLNRLQGQGTQGFQAANARSGLEMDRGSAIVGLTMDGARFKAGNTIGQGHARADGATSRWGSISGMVGDMASTFGRSQGTSGNAAGYSNELPWSPNYRGY